MDADDLARTLYVPPPPRRGPARCTVCCPDSLAMRDVWAALDAAGWRLVTMDKPIADGAGDVTATFERA